MNNQNTYDTLYNNMKTSFTVVSGNQEYTLGDFMSMKATAKSSNLPATKAPANQNRTVAAVFSYVNDKLAVKKAPVKDKTIRSFPIRTSAASFLSAIVACALIFSFGIFTARGNDATTASVEEGELTSETEVVTNN